MATPNVDTSLKIHKDKAKDVLMVQKTTKGKYGAAQLRVVMNLTPVRQLAKKILDEKVSDIMGRDTAAPRKSVETLTNRLAVRGVCGLSLKAGSSPLAAFKQATQSAASAQGSKYVRVNKIVAAYHKDKLKKYGGIDGLAKKMEQKRAHDANELLAKGIPPQLVQVKSDRAAAEDKWVLREAAKQLGLEEVKSEDHDEASGFRLNPFRRKKGKSRQQRLAEAEKRLADAEEEQSVRRAEEEAKNAQEDLKTPGPKDDGKDEQEEPAQTAGEGHGMTRAQLLRRLLLRARKRRHHRGQGWRGMHGASQKEQAATAVVPGGPATALVAKFAWKRGGKKHAASAVKLSKARNGDPKAIAHIKKTSAAAKKGDPKAKAEMKRLHAVNEMAKHIQKKGAYSKLLDAGVAGKFDKTSGTVEAVYGDLLSSGCT